MINSVIHIGANKTGSTTLQRNVFPKSEGLVYMGEDGEGYEGYKDIVNSLVSDDDIYYQPEETRRLFESFLDQAAGKTFLYSNEDIMTSRVPALCARRLKQLLPDAKIIVVIRNQLTAIQSWYVNHGAYLRNVPRSYWHRYVSFDDWMNYCTTFIKYSPIDGFFYHRIVNMYVSLFGKNNVHVLLYEDFMHKKEMFVNDLCQILGTDARDALKRLDGPRERRRNTLRELRYHRFRTSLLRDISISRYLPGGKQLKQMWLQFLEAGPPADSFMSDRWKEKITGLYGEDNSRLAEMFGLPLEGYYYPLAHR
jgi:hypothetical protein